MGTYEEIRLRVSDEALSFQGAEGVNRDGSDPWPDRLVHAGGVRGEVTQVLVRVMRQIWWVISMGARAGTGQTCHGSSC